MVHAWYPTMHLRYAACTHKPHIPQNAMRKDTVAMTTVHSLAETGAVLPSLLARPARAQAKPCLHGHVTGNAPDPMRMRAHLGPCCPGLHGDTWEHTVDHRLRMGTRVSQVYMATRGPLATWHATCWGMLPWPHVAMHP